MLEPRYLVSYDLNSPLRSGNFFYFLLRGFVLSCVVLKFLLEGTESNEQREWEVWCFRIFLSGWGCDGQRVRTVRDRQGPADIGQ